MKLYLLFVLTLQFGAVRIQRFTAADDRGSLGDGPRHITDKFAVHGRSPGW